MCIFLIFKQQKNKKLNFFNNIISKKRLLKLVSVLLSVAVLTDIIAYLYAQKNVCMCVFCCCLYKKIKSLLKGIRKIFFKNLYKYRKSRKLQVVRVR